MIQRKTCVMQANMPTESHSMQQKELLGHLLKQMTRKRDNVSGKRSRTFL